MATFRKVHVQFWTDPFIQELTPEQKFFFLYLLTNDRTKQCGIYEITKRQICFDTGYNIDTVSKLLGYFINTEKIRYNTETNEIAIKNWNKFNGSDSPKVQVLVNQELESVKDIVLIEYLYGSDNVVIRNHNKNKNKNRIEEEKNGASESATVAEKEWRKECANFLKDTIWKEKFCMAKNIKMEALEESMKKFITNLNLKEDYKNNPALKVHYTNHFNKYGLIVAQIDAADIKLQPKINLK